MFTCTTSTLWMKKFSDFTPPRKNSSRKLSKQHNDQSTIGPVLFSWNDGTVIFLHDRETCYSLSGALSMARWRLQGRTHTPSLRVRCARVSVLFGWQQLNLIYTYRLTFQSTIRLIGAATPRSEKTGSINLKYRYTILVIRIKAVLPTSFDKKS